MRQIIDNYKPIVEFTGSKGNPEGGSCAPKGVIFHILEDNKQEVEVLDIGFGLGGLGHIIKITAETKHWSVDGIDGYEPNCQNIDLINKRIYRNIWHGYAQELSFDKLSRYKIICLLDVIEHLNIETAKYLFRTILSGMGDESYLFISTPLWYMPQDSIYEGDLEEHLIGIPITSMMALMPRMYALGTATVGGFVYGKNSLNYIDFFQPSTDKKFNEEMGRNIIKVINIPLTPGILHKITY
jgi:2-polyprenyl-3-methyl-5-hydroxy-6-metoxy-1,4-benzoquinol methylase